MIIGLTGYARVGKDTLADLLVEQYGYEKRSFAQPMRDALYALNPKIDYDLRLQEIIDFWGWDGYKQSEHGVEIRALMQRLGTEVGRKQFGENFWVKQGIPVDLGNNYVFSDVRFDNEAYAIRRAGGVIIRLKRDEVGPANDHESELGIDKIDADMVIENKTPELALMEVVDLLDYLED